MKRCSSLLVILALFVLPACSKTTETAPEGKKTEKATSPAEPDPEEPKEPAAEPEKPAADEAAPEPAKPSGGDSISDDDIAEEGGDDIE